MSHQPPKQNKKAPQHTAKEKKNAEAAEEARGRHARVHQEITRVTPSAIAVCRDGACCAVSPCARLGISDTPNASSECWREGCLDDLRQVRRHFLQCEAGIVTVFGVAGEHVHVLADQPRVAAQRAMEQRLRVAREHQAAKQAHVLERARDGSVSAHIERKCA